MAPSKLSLSPFPINRRLHTAPTRLKRCATGPATSSLRLSGDLSPTTSPQNSQCLPYQANITAFATSEALIIEQANGRAQLLRTKSAQPELEQPRRMERLWRGYAPLAVLRAVVGGGSCGWSRDV